jgi:prevent-host-death family protein
LSLIAKAFLNAIGIRELEKNLSEALRQVQVGEIIEVTNRGRITARVVPVRLQKRDTEGICAALTDVDE